MFLLRKSINYGSLNGISRRFLSIHEYQSMGLLRSFNIPVPDGGVASTPEEAFQVASKLKTEDMMIKAQVLAGGRGLGSFTNGLKGGVKTIYTPNEAKLYSEQMLGQKLITKQTGPKGKICNLVYICERLYARKELYVAILLDRKSKAPVLVASPHGGMDIEQVAHENPGAIFKKIVDIEKGLSLSDAKEMASKLGLNSTSTVQAAEIMVSLYKLFIAKDCSLVEINPLSEISNGKVYCLDAKLNFDDNADFRQEQIFKLSDPTQQDPREVAATAAKLNYIGLDGTIGCLVNGAGLAMATMDIIKLKGGDPANFLDVGGSATVDQVTDAFKIISGDPHVKAILVNIFGGIMKCDIIAQGVITAVKTLNLSLPLVVRLQGTRVQEAKDLIANSGLKIVASDDLEDAANKVVQMANIVEMAKKANINVHFETPLK